MNAIIGIFSRILVGAVVLLFGFGCLLITIRQWPVFPLPPSPRVAPVLGLLPRDDDDENSN
jgi:hypothetical protein